MISSIGFIPVKEDIEKLEPFVVDKQVQEKLSYLQIPIIENLQNEDDEEASVIKKTDGLLFCTLNTEEISNLAFYGYDDEEMYFHHDAMVFSTIIEGCYLEGCSQKDTLVALATFESDVLVYDAMVNFPILPQAVLQGHEGPVMSIKSKERRLLSGSEDELIIEWDLETLKIKNKISAGLPIYNLDFQGKSVVFLSDKDISINNTLVTLSDEIEKVKIHNNYVLAADHVGQMTVFDIRMPEKPLFTQKIHDDVITDILVVNEDIITTSGDSHVKVFHLNSELVLKNDIVQDEVVYSLGFNPYDARNEIFCGTAGNNVYPIQLNTANDQELNKFIR